MSAFFFFFLLPSVLQSVLMHSTFGLFYCCFTMQYRKLGLRLGVKLPLFLPKLFFSVSVQFHRSFLFFFFSSETRKTDLSTGPCGVRPFDFHPM